jgi:hypothetical protein
MSSYIPRRNFIKKAAMAAGATIAAPYILPSGRLFAASGNRLANHVVFCLFAGGIRNIESVKKERGNLLPGLLGGAPSVDPVIAGGMDPLPAFSGQSLLSSGTLFREFRYKQGPTGHFNGHTTAITGNYTLYDLNIKEPPKTPTIFEYYRKHNSPSQTALNAWWVSNTLGPYPSLNYSSYAGYGALYGANYIQPSSIISQNGYNALAKPLDFTGNDKDAINNLRNFFNATFSKSYTEDNAGVYNPGSDGPALQNFLKTELADAASGQYGNIWGVGNALNGDIFNMYFAQQIIASYKPELLVVNMQGVDICHTNFTEYCNNLRKADYAVSKLWQAIQNTPGMANDTILIVAPEHGRNLQGNTLTDAFGQVAFDHTSDATSREIFCLIAGPPGKVRQNQVISQLVGESIDIVPTIAHILGFAGDIPGGMLPGRALTEAFI